MFSFGYIIAARRDTFT